MINSVALDYVVLLEQFVGELDAGLRQLNTSNNKQRSFGVAICEHCLLVLCLECHLREARDDWIAMADARHHQAKEVM